MIVEAVRASRPGVVVHDVQTLDAIVARATAPWRFAAWVFSLFCGAAFVLALLGLVSVVSLDIAYRRHEFAIRLALGAPSRDIVRRAASTAALRVSLGLACGLTASSVAVSSLRGLLFGFTPFDWVTYTAVTLAVLLTATLAALGPVYDALRTNPAGVLRRG
ncbi:acidobacterial duplicated orphan permease [Luteitalea pratensis]|uniref:Acidobacterial duplicated orphan permease n=1 Tax=Luteitalea pratensis TaxID=1855912 RepID=A0A143PLB6_LUTPR|nr:FtsX-like permease family protein [Luteitalea pratensis]AMY09365.1 acidobacterial duplicated orphan permease [Luteitalea pratensis]